MEISFRVNFVGGFCDAVLSSLAIVSFLFWISSLTHLAKLAVHWLGGVGGFIFSSEGIYILYTITKSEFAQAQHC